MHATTRQETDLKKINTILGSMNSKMLEWKDSRIGELNIPNAKG